MTDYRLVMSLLIQNLSYRQIESLAACSHATIAKAKRACRDHNLTTTAQINELSAEDIDALFTDGRKTPSAEFVAFDVAAMVKAHRHEQAPTACPVGRLPRHRRRAWSAPLQLPTLLLDHRRLRQRPKPAWVGERA